MTSGKTIALTRRSFVGKVMSLLFQGDTIQTITLSIPSLPLNISLSDSFNIIFSFFFFFFYCIYLAMLSLSCGMWDLVLSPRIELRSSAFGVLNLSHWSTREVPIMSYMLYLCSKMSSGFTIHSERKPYSLMAYTSLHAQLLSPTLSALVFSPVSPLACFVSVLWPLCFALKLRQVESPQSHSTCCHLFKRCYSPNYALDLYPHIIQTFIQISPTRKGFPRIKLKF